jgi:cell division protein FtsX
MYGGPLMLLRQSVEQMRYARPWQQTLFAAALIAVGVALIVVLQHPIGILPIVLGIAFIRGTVRGAIRSRRNRSTHHVEKQGSGSNPPL